MEERFCHGVAPMQQLAAFSALCLRAPDVIKKSEWSAIANHYKKNASCPGRSPDRARFLRGIFHYEFAVDVFAITRLLY
ncbi:hypothetical protein ACS3UN_10485 [Oscillospiraceae bacterium LTW-04]|nr:hypothetical protein RBH76_12235 [Oscillospiraceae bacterium MB24-C1]